MRNLLTMGRRAVRAGLAASLIVAALGAGALSARAESGNALRALDLRADGSRVLNLVVHDTPLAVPAIAFVDEMGRSHSLEEFRGKVAAVHFWATWCYPCRAELPTIDALQRVLGDDGLVVLALSLDRTGAETVRAYYDEAGVRSLALYIDTKMRAARALRVNGVPYTIFIDRSGREIARVLGDRDWTDPDVVALVRRIVE